MNQFVSPGSFKIGIQKSNTVVTGKSFTYRGNEQIGEINGPMRTVIENAQLVLDEMNMSFSMINRIIFWILLFSISSINFMRMTIKQG